MQLALEKFFSQHSFGPFVPFPALAGSSSWESFFSLSLPMVAPWVLVVPLFGGCYFTWSSLCLGRCVGWVSVSEDLPGALWGGSLTLAPLRCALLHPGPAGTALMGWVPLFPLSSSLFCFQQTQSCFFKVLAQLEYP